MGHVGFALAIANSCKGSVNVRLCARNIEQWPGQQRHGWKRGGEPCQQGSVCAYSGAELRGDDRVLPIVVGQFEAQAIQIGLMEEKTARPMTHDLFKNF